ncbi:MAG TPA: NACHT domain-containing protein, partial [Micromonosporaceae bacterium]|nr:NACHT domain-containing protein [Micromonosporaceae bacterium]
MPFPALLVAPPPAPADPGSLPSWLAPALGFGGAVLAALIALAGVLWVRRKNAQAEQRRLELDEAKLALDREKQEFERYKAEQSWAREDRTAQEDRRRADREAREAEVARALSANRRDGAEAAYRTRLHHELGQIKILDMTRPLDLGRIFVQVRVREHEPLRHVDEADLLAADKRDVRRAHAAAETSGRAAVTLEPGEALRRHRRVVVLGDPGAGKTTMMRHLAYRMSAPDAADAQLPVFVELRAYVDSGCRSILRYVTERLTIDYGFPVSEEDLSARLDAGRAVLLLDGLDEIAGDRERPDGAASAYATVTRQIAGLSVRYHTAGIAVTCRRHGWREGLPGFHVLDALDFEGPQVDRFLRGWFAGMPHMGSRLGRVLEGSPRLRELAANPLLLSLIAIVYEQDLELPERRAALYRRCVDVLLREWDSHRRIERVSQFTTDHKRDLLKAVAWHYHRAGKRYFAEDDLLARIAGFLPTVALDPADASAILDEIAAQYGLLKAQAHGWYGFLHLTLQEYFAAEALLEGGQEGVGELLRHRYDPWWEEVLLLFAGATADAGPLLRGILRVGPGSPVEPADDDIFDSDLLLAARCLAGSPRVADPSLRGAIVAAVRQRALASRHAYEAGRAARALVDLSDPAGRVELFDLAVRPATPVPVSVALIDALAAHGSAALGERFLAALRRLDGDSARMRPVRGALIAGLGAMRYGPALPYLTQLARSGLAGSVEAVEVVMAAARAAARGSDDAGPVLALARELVVRDEVGWGVASAAVDGLVDLRDAAHADELFALLTTCHPRARETVAAGYLELAGNRGAARLAALASPRGTGAELGVPALAAVAGRLERVADAASVELARPALLRLAVDPGADPRLVWMASACLDHAAPGGELDGVVGSGELGRLGLDATRAAWGDPAGL